MDSLRPNAVGPPAPKRQRRILVAYNHTELSALAEAPEPADDSVRELTALIAAQGFDVFAVNAEDDCDRLGDAVVLYKPDLILNLIDHFHGQTLLAGAAASLLDIFEFPYTGGDEHCIGGCHDRLRSRLILSSADVRVPAFVPLWTPTAAADLAVDLTALEYPVILTQSFDDIYHRPYERPLLANADELRAFTAEVLVDYEPPFLIEEYVGHQKMSVIVIDNQQALAPCEVWRDEDDEWQVGLADLTPEQAEYIRAVALEASSAMACRDWSQVEIAINSAGTVYVTDVRPNVTPWNPDSPFRVAAADHEDGASGVLAQVIASGLRRAERQAKIEADLLAELTDAPNDEAPAETSEHEAPEAPAAETSSGPTEADPPISS